MRCVCFEGNKMCTLDSYHQHVLAYLQHLVYLDYVLIDKKQVAQIQVLRGLLGLWTYVPTSLAFPSINPAISLLQIDFRKATNWTS